MLKMIGLGILMLGTAIPIGIELYRIKKRHGEYYYSFWIAWGFTVVGLLLTTLTPTETLNITVGSISSSTAYELLRDITLIELTIITLLAAIIGFTLFYILRDRLTKNITSKTKALVDESCDRIQARINIHDGVIHWIGGMHERAFRLTQIGLELGSKLLDEPELIMAESNCGYYLAEDHQRRNLPHLKERAIKLVLRGYEKYDQFVEYYNRTDWIDNYVFVRSRFCENKQEQNEIIQLINQLKERSDLKDIKEFLDDSNNYLLGLKNLN